MQTMYPAVVNSPKTELVVAITETDAEIEVADVSVLLQPEGLAVIGNGEGAETIKYSTVEGNILKGCIRGFQGTAKPWGAGTRLARNFTAYDHDAFKANIEQHETAISALEDRLDTSDTVDITLQPGLQVVNAAKHSRFNLAEIKGRTLIDLHGGLGDYEDVSRVAAWQATVSQDETNKTRGQYGVKVVINSGFTNGGARMPDIQLIAGRYYLLIGKVKNGTATSTQLQMPGVGGVVTSAYTDTTKFGTVWCKFSPSVDITSGATVLVSGAEGTYGYADEVRVFEISSSEYAALDAMTDEQVDEKYPFVPSGIIGVENPYAIRYGKNLIPPFYEWATVNNVTVNIAAPYSASLTKTESNGFAWLQTASMQLPENPVYAYFTEVSSVSVSGGKGAYIQLLYYDKDGTRLSESDQTLYITEVGTKLIQANTPPEAKSMRAVIGFDSASTGSVTVTNPMLNIGSEALPFVPREDTTLALQTELHANPVDGSDPDILFEKEGQYFKLAKWKKVVLDGSLNWEPTSNVFSGHKLVRLVGVVPSVPNDGYMKDISAMVNYKGDKLDYSVGNGSTWTKESYQIWSNVIYVAIPNNDSGWGPDYTPTANEIKAYFMGWKMYPDNPYGRQDQYQGTGTKFWYPITRIKDTIDNTYRVSGTAPTALANNKDTWKPYQLLYRLAKEVAEPVPFEGALVLPEGQSVVEVGTGIVVREGTDPAVGGTSAGINIIGTVNSPLKSKVSKILSIYRNGANDPRWTVVDRTDGSAYGLQRAAIDISSYSANDSYSVTYIKLDKSPIQPIKGVVADNEKAQIIDMTAAVGEALQQVSVAKKNYEEKYVTGWITPTLLNGWATYNQAPSYLKDQSNFVHLKGRVSSGSTTSGTVIFSLPPGFRPGELRKFIVAVYPGSGNTSSGALNINYADGTVTVDYLPGNGWVSLDNIVFLAEK